jgi:uncharacterized protein
VQIKVKPNARTSSLMQLADGTWLAQLKSTPVDGKANAELIVLVAKQLGCPRKVIGIKVGAGADETGVCSRVLKSFGSIALL